MYLGELAPAHLRGSVGSAIAVASAAGTLTAHMLGFCDQFGAVGLWFWSMQPVSVATVSLLQLGVLSHLPESPR